MSTQGARTIGSFTIERELGQGGMGVVLLGRHVSLDRPAVLKRMRPELAADPELAERFAREARAAAAVHHQNVVAVYDWIAWRGEHYIAQEYVDGVDLSEALSHAGRFPWRIAALVALELARGLEAIHARGMVHRDLKPANALLGRSGDVKIADFGIALDATQHGLTRPGISIGSPPYIAPEQLLGERVDARCDLFALGVVIYELLAGVPPFREPSGDESDTLLQRIQRERFEAVRRAAPQAPRWLARLVRSLLRAKPRKRPSSSQAVRRTLEQRLGAFPAEARAELAAWLWETNVFRPREGDTVVLAVPAAHLGRRLALRWAAAALATVVLGSFLLLRGDPARWRSLAERASGVVAPEASARSELALRRALPDAIPPAPAAPVEAAVAAPAEASARPPAPAPTAAASTTAGPRATGARSTAKAKTATPTRPSGKARPASPTRAATRR